MYCLLSYKLVVCDIFGCCLTFHTDGVAKGPFIATQLNSTSSWVELSCVTIDTLTDTTQLLPTIGNTTDPVAAYSQSVRSRSVELSCVDVAVDTSLTQLNSMLSWVAGRWVELRHYKWALRPSLSGSLCVIYRLQSSVFTHSLTHCCAWSLLCSMLIVVAVSTVTGETCQIQSHKPIFSPSHVPKYSLVGAVFSVNLEQCL